jgi:hypothetical protein
MAVVSTEIRETRAPVGGFAWIWSKRVALSYLSAALAVTTGLLVTRNQQLVDPENGLGYWLGITGASLMLILLLYPARKRFRIMRRLGATRYWFRAHMIFGVLGPLAILYHCNFRLGSLNSKVALFCTLLVASSGLIGRYLHAKIYIDLDGHKASLRKLAERARFTDKQRHHANRLVPELIERIARFDEIVLRPPQGFLATLLLPAKLAVQTRVEHFALMLFVRKRLRLQARTSATMAAERKRLCATVSRFLGEHLKRVRRVAELGSYERLFALWHVFHLPFFYMLVLTALLHVVAVHMY